MGGQGGCEQRSKVFVKIQKKKIEGGWVGVGWGSGGSDQELGWGRWGSKVWGRWGMWGMGDVNQEWSAFLVGRTPLCWFCHDACPFITK